MSLMVFIRHADQYGLPVSFLRYVQSRGYRVMTPLQFRLRVIPWPRLLSQPATFPTFNVMVFPQSTFRGLRHMDQPYEISAGSLTDVYHECTHAYFDLKEERNDANVLALIRAGEDYYTNAPLEGGDLTDNPRGVFNEAAAEYVGWRVTIWWVAFTNLLQINSGQFSNSDPMTREQASQLLQHTRTLYNRDAGIATFGTQQRRFGRDLQTTRRIMPQLRQFLDRELLENRIPDNFDSVPRFWGLLILIRARYGQLARLQGLQSRAARARLSVQPVATDRPRPMRTAAPLGTRV